MKILLIYPYFLDERLSDSEISVLPIGMYYIVALLKENHYDVELLNWYNMKDKHDEIKKTLQEKKPDVIGFSIFHANRWGAIDIAKLSKTILPHTKIVFGGIGATFLWEHLLKNFSEIDYIVLGEGEYTFLNLLKYIDNEKKLETIKGIAFRKDGYPFKTDSAEYIEDVDSLPMPSRYFTYQHLVSSRGCPYNCNFCGSPRFWSQKVRFHSPDYFVEQIQLLYEKGITFFYISDDTFTIKENRVIEICKRIIKSGLKIHWYAISRVNLINEEMLYWMRKAGCIQVSYGIESGSEKIRRTLNKNIKVDDIKRAFEITSKYGILPRAYFIYGSPNETDDTIQETIDLMYEIKPLASIFYILDIFPGTALYDAFQQKTKIGDDLWLKRIEDITYFETDERLPKDKVFAFGERLRTAFYKELPNFVENIRLVNNDALFETHSDFLTRLAMTFSHGDYAAIEAIPEKDKIAEKLYTKALSYFPDHYAYLGLGIIKQRQRRFNESITILSEGKRYYPKSEQISVCLGISYMNIGQFNEALKCLEPFKDSKLALKYIASCYRGLGELKKEAEILKKLGEIGVRS